MYAEDFHAIRCLTDGLRTIGSEEVTCTAQEYWQLQPKDNRAFVCVPSNPPGLAALASIRNKRLEVRIGGSKEEREILWRQRDGNVLHIFSPLSLYLKKQDELLGQLDERSRTVIQRERVAVDFGVLARYFVEDPGVEERAVIFLFGLRSLGTMGAAWFLDRNIAGARSFSASEEPIEKLLRVAFSNGRIASVEDVSEQTAEYFEREVSEEMVMREIRANASGLLLEAIDAFHDESD